MDKNIDINLDNQPGIIMIIDDNPQNLYTLEKLLTENGHKVRPAPNGTMALKALQSFLPDLILLDIRMPELDGYEVCRQIKADDRTRVVPVIFISALEDVADKVKGFETGGIDYITKPFQSEEVLARVKTHLTLRKAEKVLKRSHEELENLVAQRTAELARAKEMAESSNRAKSNFLNNISHEIRTPLNAIMGFSGLLSELITDQEQKTFIDIVNSGGANLLTLLNDIIDLSKIESEKMEIISEVFDFQIVFRQITQVFAPMISEKQVEFKTEISEKVPKYLLLDKTRIRQILFNLTGNAVKFTDKGFIKLSADFHPEKQNLIITIQDTGIGIPPESQEIIFQAFTQHDGGTNRKYGGAGLGLTLSSRLIQMMNGTLSLKSEPGKGSIFTITLPALQNRTSGKETEMKAAQVIESHL